LLMLIDLFEHGGKERFIGTNYCVQETRRPLIYS
jgi:hypothetical protein